MRGKRELPRRGLRPRKPQENEESQVSQQTGGPERVSFRRLIYESLPELWGFQFLAAMVLAIPVSIIRSIITSVVNSTGSAITTANIMNYLINWRTPVLLALLVLLVYVYVGMELFALIYLSADVLSGEPMGIRREMSRGFSALRRFQNPAGAMALLYVFIAAPLCGLGFSISLTSAFHIPNFIMDVVVKTPLYLAAYIVLLLVLMWIGYRSCFVLHAVLLDGMTPAKGYKASALIVKTHGKKLALGMIATLLLLGLVQLAASFIFSDLPGMFVERFGADLPRPYVINLFEENVAVDDAVVLVKVLVYRILSALVVFVGSYLESVLVFIGGAYLMLRFTRYYIEFTREEPADWPERPKHGSYVLRIMGMVAVIVVIVTGSFVVGLLYNQVIERSDPVKIVAHRAGGTMASENSIEGLEKAIEHGCYASEIDVQRTLDGYYIINHDSDFKRLTGVAMEPQEMTMDQVRELRIQDTTGNGRELPVVTLEEMLPVIKGRIKLFIELKGATADRQMADDVVRLVREMDCVKDVTIISLEYDVIDYVETQYPEFETGVLFFAGLGDVTKLNCDLLIMEEAMGTPGRISDIHGAGKQAIVWTVNTETSMRHFLSSDVDAIITDMVEMAEQVQAKLDARTEFQTLRDIQTDSFNE